MVLNHRVTLQTKVATVDTIGQPSTAWTNTADLWANVKHLNGISTIKAGADTSISKVSIRVRHGVFNAGQRIVYDASVYDIEAVLPDGKKTYIDLVCVKNG